MRLYNFVIFIRRSSQRRELFSELYDEGEKDMILIQDNVTRWNNVFLMINRALSKISTIKIFIIENETERDAKKRLLKEDILTSEDWRVLAETKTILVSRLSICNRGLKKVPIELFGRYFY